MINPYTMKDYKKFTLFKQSNKVRQDIYCQHCLKIIKKRYGDEDKQVSHDCPALRVGLIYERKI